MATTAQPEIKYQAAFNAEDGEVVITRDIRAGISGPFGEFAADSLEVAEHVLFDAGYLVTAPWGETTVNGDRWCTLTPMS